METNSSGDTSTHEPKEFDNFCIRRYVADVRRKDWKKCCPFNPSSDSADSNFLAKRVFASLILEDHDALVNTPENMEAPNSLTSSEGRNLEVQPAISETHTGVVVGNDKTSTVYDKPLESASCKVTYGHCQIEKAIDRDMVAAENDKPEDALVNDDSMNHIDDGASKSSSRKLMEDVQYQNEKNIPEDTIAAGSDMNTAVDDDGANTISDEERNLAGEKPQKFRLLSDILKELAGPCDAVSVGCGDSDFSSESEDDSDEFTLNKFVKKKKGICVTSKSGIVSKKKNGSCKIRDRSYDQDKRMKPVPTDSCHKDPVSASYGESEFSSESEDDSDDFTLKKYVRKKKGICVTSKSGIVPKKKNRLCKIRDRSNDQAKRMKHVPVDSCHKDPVSASYGDSEFSSESEDDSDDFTLKKYVRKKKGICVTSKSGIVSKKKNRLCKIRDRSNDRAKRMNHVPTDSCHKDPVSASYGDSEFSSESEDDSDDFTLKKYVRKKKGICVTSKSGIVSKTKNRSCKIQDRSYDRAKRMKPVPPDSCHKDPELGLKRPLRKTRKDEVDLLVLNKHRETSTKIIMHESTSGSQKVAPSSLAGAENMSGTQKDSLILCGKKRNRETIQHNSGTEVLKFLAGNQRRFTEENNSRATHGAESAQLVQPDIVVLNNIETTSACVKKSIRENSPPIDDESMAASQLLRLFTSGLTTHTSSKTATEDPTLSLSNCEISCGIDEKVSSASGSIVGQSHKEFNVINGDGSPQTEQVESETYVCTMNMNPSEFSIPNAKKHMRRVKVIRK